MSPSSTQTLTHMEAVCLEMYAFALLGKLIEAWKYMIHVWTAFRFMLGSSVLKGGQWRELHSAEYCNHI